MPAGIKPLFDISLQFSGGQSMTIAVIAVLIMLLLWIWGVLQRRKGKALMEIDWTNLMIVGLAGVVMCALLAIVAALLREPSARQADKSAYFLVEKVVPATEATPKAQWIEVRALVRFVESVQGVNLAVFARPNIHLERKSALSLVYQTQVKNYVQDEELRLPLATIFVTQEDAPGRYSFWGNDDMNPKGEPLLIGASENIAEIRLIKDGNTIQAFKSFFAVLSEGEGGLGRVFILPENRDLFAGQSEDSQ